MKVKCDYCANTYEDTLSECPDCGAPNPVQKSISDKDPKTIEELKAWYQARHLPPYDVTRFYIGIDYRNPKAFGIYEADDGDIVVYKNKADGSRAIRYKGKDEAYAVNELLQKLKEEIVNQKYRNKHNNTPNNKNGSLRNVIDAMTDSDGKFTAAGIVIIMIAALFAGCFTCIPAVIFILFWQGAHSKRKKQKIAFYTSGTVIAAITGLIITAVLLAPSPRHKRGYYTDNAAVYYNASDMNQWYCYDTDVDDWVDVSVPDFYKDNIYSEDLDAYYIGETYPWDETASELSGIYDVEDSTAYQSDESSYSSSSSDSSFDWDSSDSWDSGGSDWNSDW